MDAVEANRKADAADEAYLAGCNAQGVYPLVYHPHNNHFRWVAAAFAGLSSEAIEAAEKVRRQVSSADVLPMHSAADTAFLQHFGASPLFAWVRFARWERVLADPEPAENLHYARAIRHYARGMAQLRTGHPAEAQAELAALSKIVAGPEIEGLTIGGFNSFRNVLTVAEKTLAGELANARGDRDGSIALLHEAMKVEDALIYQEPPDWYLPVRQILGAVYLEAGRPAEAERVYREDLSELPSNGWSLFGLAQSLDAQGKVAEAAQARAQLAEVWKVADFQLTSSRF
jgi:tetratricopeptide (TPR) repeat protein